MDKAAYPMLHTHVGQDPLPVEQWRVVVKEIKEAQRSFPDVSETQLIEQFIRDWSLKEQTAFKRWYRQEKQSTNSLYKRTSMSDSVILRKRSEIRQKLAQALPGGEVRQWSDWLTSPIQTAKGVGKLRGLSPESQAAYEHMISAQETLTHVMQQAREDIKILLRAVSQYDMQTLGQAMPKLKANLGSALQKAQAVRGGYVKLQKHMKATSDQAVNYEKIGPVTFNSQPAQSVQQTQPAQPAQQTQQVQPAQQTVNAPTASAQLKANIAIRQAILQKTAIDPMTILLGLGVGAALWNTAKKLISAKPEFKQQLQGFKASLKSLDKTLITTIKDMKPLRQYLVRGNLDQWSQGYTKIHNSLVGALRKIDDNVINQYQSFGQSMQQYMQQNDMINSKTGKPTNHLYEINEQSQEGYQNTLQHQQQSRQKEEQLSNAVQEATEVAQTTQINGDTTFSTTEIDLELIEDLSNTIQQPENTTERESNLQEAMSDVNVIMNKLTPEQSRAIAPIYQVLFDKSGLKPPEVWKLLETLKPYLQKTQGTLESQKKVKPTVPSINSAITPKQLEPISPAENELEALSSEQAEAKTQIMPQPLRPKQRGIETLELPKATLEDLETLDEDTKQARASQNLPEINKFLDNYFANLLGKEVSFNAKYTSRGRKKVKVDESLIKNLREKIAGEEKAQEALIRKTPAESVRALQNALGKGGVRGEALALIDYEREQKKTQANVKQNSMRRASFLRKTLLKTIV